MYGFTSAPGRKRPSTLTGLLALVLLSLVGCGGGAGGSAGTQPPAGGCEPSDPATHEQCGTVLVALTDADGDFLNYTVDVLSLELETANGRVVETLPRSTRINFTDYVDLTELVTAATIPAATYVSGAITIDYGDAEVFVEASGEAKEAVVTDPEGNPLGEVTLNIRLSDRDRLVILPGRPALLQLDFDLAASHVVDIVPTPATAASETFIVAEVQPVGEKEIRARGPLVSVDLAASSYVVAIRPFHDRAGDFGRVTVHTAGDTQFEIDGEGAVGADGLAALAAAGPGTPTAAFGTLDVAQRRFTADIVLAGSSVPGIGLDAVLGNVIARDGNFLTIRGATVVPSDRVAHFHDDVVVEVGPETRVFKDGDPGADLDIGAISIGQRLTVRGTLGAAETDASAPEILFDATQGAVRMHLTHLSGIVNSAMPGQAYINLFAIDRRRAGVFDFGGTGASPDLDADPENYEMATGLLTLASFAEGKPIAARGFPAPFGTAPPDFTGRTVIDFTGVRSLIGVGWGIDGATAPFLSMNADGLLLDNGNEAIDQRHFVKQGPVLIDLTTLASDTLIVPKADGRPLYSIKSGDSIRLYTDFADFVSDLTASLDGATAARSLYGHGEYDAASNVFTATRLGVFLVGP